MVGDKNPEFKITPAICTRVAIMASISFPNSDALMPVERHDGGERQGVLMGSILLYTTMKIPTVT